MCSLITLLSPQKSLVFCTISGFFFYNVTIPTSPSPTLTHTHTGLVGEALLDLFSGQCEFSQTFGIRRYPSPDGFNFEGGVRSDEAWSSWNGSPPEITEEEALCGRHSLYVSVLHMCMSVLCGHHHNASAYEQGHRRVLGVHAVRDGGYKRRPCELNKIQ